MLKLGYCNFWSNDLQDHIRKSYLLPLIMAGLDFEDAIYNPFAVECDLVIHSVFNTRLQDIKGTPVFVCYSGENRLDGYLHPNGYSLSFRQDSERNLYYPIWQDCYEQTMVHRISSEILLEEKFRPENISKFCTFIVSNEHSQFRNLIAGALNNYKKIDSIGTALNNQENGFILPRDFDKAVEYHKGYKFNLCFENTKDETEDTIYITEKIMNAYMYGTVPIYWGSDKVLDYFNEEAFINCNDKSIPEILERVEELDNNQELYSKMLTTPLFKENIMWNEYLQKRYIEFITKILKDNNKIA